MLYALPLILALSGMAAGQQASPPAQVPAQPVQKARPPAPPPFDEKADAQALIDAAVKAAAADDIRVLITWGANEESGSKLFIAAKRAPDIAKAGFFSDEYKSVNVNVGKLDRNIDLAKHYGAKLKGDALPALTVLNAAGKVLANTDAAALRPATDAAGIDPGKVAAFLKSHQAPAPDAVAPFNAALKRAEKEGKTVFVWFAAPW